jgi:CBS domain-containing protein
VRRFAGVARARILIGEIAMKVEACMNTDIRIASPAQPIRDAARTMKEIDAGFLPVGENDRLVGIVTDRDIIVRALAEGKGPDTPVRDVMTQEVLYCFEDDDFGVVSSLMGELKVRRLPVLNASKRLIGIILTRGDLAGRR